MRAESLSPPPTGDTTARGVLAARDRIRSLVRQTPAVRSPALDRLAGLPIVLKAENLQEGGSFKFRGATNYVAASDRRARERGFATLTSGNHGIAVGLAAARVGAAATVLMTSDADPDKTAAAARTGATIVRLQPNEASDWDEVMAGHPTCASANVIHPFDDALVIEGQATATLELLEQAPDIRSLVVPCGGGGLLAGAALAMEAKRRRLQLVGVQPAASHACELSLRMRRRVARTPGNTIADGQRVPAPGHLTYALIQRSCDAIVTVDDQAIVTAMTWAARHANLRLEPSGATGLAAVLTARHRFQPPVGVILSGGNVGRERFQRLQAAASRYAEADAGQG